MNIGLPTLDLGIPGLLPSVTLPPSFPFPGRLHPLNQLGGLGERCKLPQLDLTNDFVHICAKRSSSGGNSFCAFS